MIHTSTQTKVLYVLHVYVSAKLSLFPPNESF